MNAVSLLEIIDYELDVRISDLKKLNDRYSSILKLLDGESCRTYPASGSHEVLEKKDAMEISAQSNDLNLPVALDDILLKAKAIRNHQPLTKPKATSKSKHQSTSGSIRRFVENQKPTTASTIKIDSDNKALESAQKERSQPIDIGQKHFVNWRKQIKLLENANLVNPFLLTLPLTPLILSETKLLSALAARPCMSPSTIARLVGLHEWPSTIYSNLDMNKMSQLTCQVSYAQTARMGYEKVLKSKLSRLSIEHLSDEEVRQIFVWWYNLRRCYSNYELIERVNGVCTCACKEQPISVLEVIDPDDNEDQVSAGSVDVLRLFSLVRDMTKVLPAATPLDTLPTPVLDSPGLNKSQVNKVWLHSALANVGIHHAAMQSRVRYAAETIISKLVLKDTVHSLKECCQKTLAHDNDSLRVSSSTTSRHTSRGTHSRERLAVLEEWVSSLQQYQSAESCLLQEATAMPSTMFFLKK